MNKTQNPTIDSNTTVPTPTAPRESSITSVQQIHGGDQIEQKIARLPKPTRDMINLMVDDGLPYHIIIEELGETAPGLQAQNLVKWVKGGYEDYVKNRQAIERLKTEAEFSADLLKALGDIDPSVIHRASLQLAAIQIFNAIDEYGEEALRDMLQVNPASYISLLNTVCNLSNASIKQEEHRQKVENE